MTGRDFRGVPVSYDNAEAIAALEAAHEDTLAFQGDAIGKIEAVLKEHPSFVMAHCFKAAWLTQAMETRIYGEMVRSVEAAEALIARANDRERGHIRAVRAWVEGDFSSAVQTWEAVLTEYPFDLLALQLVHLIEGLLHIQDMTGRLGLT